MINLRRKFNGAARTLAFKLCFFCLPALCLTAVYAQDDEKKGLEGKTEFKETKNLVSPEARLMGLIAIQDTSCQIAQRICPLFNNSEAVVGIYDNEEIKGFVNYRNTKKLLDNLLARLRRANVDAENALSEIKNTRADLLSRAELDALPKQTGENTKLEDELGNVKKIVDALTGSFGSIADLLSLFKTDTTFESFEYTLSKEQFAPAIIGRMQGAGGCRNVRFYYPSQMPGRLNAADSPLLETLRLLYDEAAKAQSYLRQISALRKLALALVSRSLEMENQINGVNKKIKDLEDKINDLNNKIAAEKDKAKKGGMNKEAGEAAKERRKLETELAAKIVDKAQVDADVNYLSNKLADLQSAEAKLKPLVDEFTTIVSALVKTDEKTQSNLLLTHLRSESAMGTFINQAQNGFLLEIASDADGSTRRTKRNLFLDLFSGFGKIKYNGIAEIRYTLYSGDGSVSRAGITQTYLNYGKISKINKIIQGIDAQCPMRAGILP